MIKQYFKPYAIATSPQDQTGILSKTKTTTKLDQKIGTQNYDPRPQQIKKIRKTNITICLVSTR